MFEHESDVLVATEDDDEEEKNSSTNTFEQSNDKNSGSSSYMSKAEPVVETNKEIERKNKDFVNYNYNNLNKVYKKYDVVQTYVPKKETTKKNKEFENFVTTQDSYTPEKETVSVEKVEHKTAFKLSKQIKVWIIAIITIFTMLGGLSIYNAINIKNLNTRIEQTTTGISDINKVIETTIKDIGKLTSDDQIQQSGEELGLSEATEDQKMTIELEQKNNVEDYVQQTNFFDKICNFFRHLFGG